MYIFYMNAKRGQPPKGSEALTRKLHVRLKEADYQDFARVSEDYKGGMAEFARRLILEGLKRLKKNQSRTRAGRKGSVA